GRIVLLNSVLNAIPIFYLSYMKISVQVWKKIRRIQGEFLWGCTRRGNKVSWIKWDVVCLPKRKGGLGVRDVRMINISLLAKWRWRLLNNDEAVWKEVIRSKYGDLALGKVVLGEECIPRSASLWWKDICSIGSNLSHNWFAQNVVKKLGNGRCTSF
ncbi:RNA-directed DNA polymerase (Reverse transcriptase), partial [Trifolium medium]|nr:RNA-directed DNA polymerase (Reverse transcriptase) [Trifolium medium]